MADDDVAPPSGPPRHVPPPPPADPVIELAGAERPAETFAEPAAEPAASDPARPDPAPAGPPVVETAGERVAAHPSWGEGATDASTASAAPLRAERSALPTVLVVLGVIIALLLAATLYTLYNPPANGALGAAQADIAALKRSVAALEARPQQTVDLGPLDSRVTAVASDVAALKTDLGATTRKADAAAQLAPALTAVQATVAGLPKVDLAPLQTGIADVQKGVADLGARVAANDDKLTAIDQRLTAGDARLAALDHRLVPLEAYFNAPKSTEQVTEARQNGSAAETRAAPLAVLAQGVLAALEQGRPFGAEADALARLGVDEPTLAPLKAVAAKGAMTQAALVSGFDAVQDRAVVAAAPVSSGTVFDRMMANAASVVSVKRTGAAKGDDAGAIASRIDADLKRGAFAAALTEWQTLPADSQATSADWAAGLKARVAAEEAARSIQAKAVAALAAAP